MTSFKDMPIRWKLTLTSTLPIVIVLLLAGLALAAFDLVTFRRFMQRDMESKARFIGLITSASLEFQQPTYADKTLQSLSSQPRIAAACIYDIEGQKFAAYTRPGNNPVVPSRPGPQGTRFQNGALVTFHPVLLNGRQIGTIYLESDLDELYSRVEAHTVTTLLGVVIFSILALALSSRLQRVISEPILRLTGLARTVSERKDYSVRAEKLAGDEVGHLTGAFNQMLEQIERQNAALRASEERIRFSLQAARVGSWDWRIPENQVTWSGITSTLLGVREGKIDNTFEGFLDVVHEDDRARVRAAVSNSVEKHQLYEIEFRVIWPERELHWLTARGEVFYDAKGNPLHMSGVVIDITERMEARQKLQLAHDRLAESVSSLEGFCYSIAHDLRAPLRAMQGFVTVLVEDYAQALDDTAREHARRIADSAVRMDQLIRDLLEYGRLSSADLPLSSVNTEALLDRLAKRLLEDERDGETATIQLPASCPRVWANATLLEQVLANLIRNGLKFVEPGTKPRVDISATQSGDTVRIQVRDNGIGIDARYHQRIFNVFERLPGPHPYSGTGIGLAIVKKGVERMRGTVGVQSKRGAGSCFWIELIRAAQHD
jgi:signal transduction histidine kinase